MQTDIADKDQGEPLRSSEGIVEIPELDMAFSAGPGSYPADHVLTIGRRPFSREWVRKKGLKPEHLALTRVCGDSMAPLLKDKDMVMLDQSVNSPMTAMPLAFRLDNELYIKLCQAAGRGNLAMISANKIYDPILIRLIHRLILPSSRRWSGMRIAGFKAGPKTVVWTARTLLIMVGCPDDPGIDGQGIMLDDAIMPFKTFQ